MRPVSFRQFVRSTLHRLRGARLRRPRLRPNTPELLEPRVLLDASLVKDIRLNTSYGDPPVEVNGMVYMQARDGTNFSTTYGYELWKSDGTSAGTVLVKDIRPGSSPSEPKNLTNVNGTLFFTATDGTNGRELWKSNGTSSGTVIVSDIRSGGPSSDSNPTFLTNVNGTLYFVANDGANGIELWKSDGSASGTVMVRDIRSNGDGFPSFLTNLNGTLVFAANNGTNGNELWKSDGTSSGTVLLQDIRSGAANSNGSPQSLTNVNGTLFFRANNGTNGYELWKSDGTSSGTMLVKDIRSGDPNSNSNPMFLTNVNGTLYFSADDGTNGRELWKSDGGPSGTVLVMDIRSGGDSSPNNLTDVSGTLFFQANDGNNGYELWKSDGTPSGTVLVADILSGDATSSSSPRYLTSVNGTVYFSAQESTNGRELWKSDGTSSGTVLVKDIQTGPSSAYPRFLKNINGTLYFTADSGIIRFSLWKVGPSNIAPTNITLSATSLAENQPAGTAVGTFTTTDPDAGDTFTYTLVSGTGDTDNASFSIDGNTLKSAASFDYETKSSYSIRVRSTDNGGEWTEKEFTISVTDGNDGATQVSLSLIVTSLLATANTTSAIPLADVSITDDGLGTNTFSVSGADAGVFEVVANQLRLKAGTVLNYATQKTYAVTVNVDDTTVGGTPDASVNYTLNLQGLDATVVQNGLASRSYVRYVTLAFGTSQGLAEAVSSIGTATPRMSLTFAGTTGTQSLARSLTSLVTVVGSEVRIDFGVNGVGGDRNSSLGDGVYRLRLDLDGDGTVDVNAKFFRLFGDVDGNGVVNDTDIGLVQTAQDQSGGNLAPDLNGDGLVNLTDLNNVKRRKGAKVAL